MVMSGCSQDWWASISVMLASTLDLSACILDCTLDFVASLEFPAHRPATQENSLATTPNASVMGYMVKRGSLVLVIAQDSKLGCSPVKIRRLLIESVRKKQHEESFQSHIQE